MENLRDELRKLNWNEELIDHYIDDQFKLAETISVTNMKYDCLDTKSIVLTDLSIIGTQKFLIKANK